MPKGRISSCRVRTPKKWNRHKWLSSCAQAAKTRQTRGNRSRKKTENKSKRTANGFTFIFIPKPLSRGKSFPPRSIIWKAQTKYEFLFRKVDKKFRIVYNVYNTVIIFRKRKETAWSNAFFQEYSSISGQSTSC